LRSTRTYEESSKSQSNYQIICASPLDNIAEPHDQEPYASLALVHLKTFEICPVSNQEDIPNEPEPLNEDELVEIRVFKLKLTAYKKSFPGKFCDLNKELFNEVMLNLNHRYQKSAGMVGITYQTAISGLEGVAKMTGSLVLLDGLSVATAKNEEIREILTQINIETGCYDSIQIPEQCLAIAMLNKKREGETHKMGKEGRVLRERAA